MDHSLAQLQRMSRFKRAAPDPAQLIGAEILAEFKLRIEKRHKKFGKIADAWLQLVPPALQERSELVTFARGTLGVIVEGSSHLFMLKQAMLAGLEQQLLLACRSQGLKKITLKAGKLSS
ncbi:MAG: DciA family protein [Tepidisphaeraceae bacterium]